MKKLYFSVLMIAVCSTTSLACVRWQQPPQSPPVVEPSLPIDSLPANQPRQPLEFSDVETGSEFDQFRSQLRQAMRDRDVEFVKALIPDEGVALGFGAPVSRQVLDDIDSGVGKTVWRILEHAIAISCGTSNPSGYPKADVNTTVYECPNVATEFLQRYPAPPDSEGVSYEISRVIVVGKNVSVHAQADRNSETIATLSDEVVKFDRAAWEEIPKAERIALAESQNGWTPVTLLNGKSGYVSNRNAYFPLGNRAIFGKVNGQWQLLDLPGGD